MGAGPSHMSQFRPASASWPGRSQGLGGPPKPAVTREIFPMTPFLTNSQAMRNSREERCMEPVWNTREFFRTVETSDQAPWMVSVSGFFAVDILPCVGRGHGDDRVPMIGSGDHHCVDVLPRQQLAEIAIRLAALVIGAALFRVVILDLLLTVIAARGIHVADRDGLGLRFREESAHEPARLLADPDKAHGELIVRLRVSGPDPRSQEKRRDAGGEGGFEKRPAGSARGVHRARVGFQIIRGRAHLLRENARLERTWAMGEERGAFFILAVRSGSTARLRRAPGTCRECPWPGPSAP